MRMRPIMEKAFEAVLFGFYFTFGVAAAVGLLALLHKIIG